jgi:hypothetical protein
VNESYFEIREVVEGIAIEKTKSGNSIFVKADEYGEYIGSRKARMIIYKISNYAEIIHHNYISKYVLKKNQLIRFPKSISIKGNKFIIKYATQGEILEENEIIQFSILPITTYTIRFEQIRVGRS